MRAGRTSTLSMDHVKIYYFSVLNGSARVRNELFILQLINVGYAKASPQANTLGYGY